MKLFTPLFKKYINSTDFIIFQKYWVNTIYISLEERSKKMILKFIFLVLYLTFSYVMGQDCNRICLALWRPICANSRNLQVQCTFSNSCYLGVRQCQRPSEGKLFYIQVICSFIIILFLFLRMDTTLWWCLSFFFKSLLSNPFILTAIRNIWKIK